MDASENKGNVYIKYNPYTVETIVRFDSGNETNGEAPKQASPLHKENLKGKRLQEWVDDLPAMLERSGRERSYTLTFHGTTLDWEDVKTSADMSPTIITKLSHIQGADPEDKIIQLKSIYEDSQKLGFDNLKDYEGVISEAFNTGFEAYVIATMSAGKSTLINALIGQKLMPSKNEACTAIVTRIYDTDDKDTFSASVFGHKDDDPRETIKELTLDAMTRFNSDESISNIVMEGNIPFVESKGMPFVLVDTPGPNNSRNPDHKTRTMKEVESGSQSLIIFVLDATQNGTESESLLLKDIAKAMKSGGKMSRDRFLFVINKLDRYDEEPENIAGLLRKNRDDLVKDYSIQDARIYPVSAAVALSALSGLQTKKEIANAETMIETPELHLDCSIEGINSHIPVAAKLEIANKLEAAIKADDVPGQSFVHSGIPVLEAAISEYVEKYAKAMRIGEIALELQNNFDCAEKVAELNDRIMTDKEERKRILAIIAILEEQINSGKSGEQYKEKLSVIIKNSLIAVNEEIERVNMRISIEVREYCDKIKEDRLAPEQAKKVYSDWKSKFDHTETELKIELSDILYNGIKQTADSFLEEYRNSIEQLIPKAEVGSLPFDPLALLGKLDEGYNPEDFQKSEEKTRTVKTGTRKAKNPDRKGFKGFFKFGKPWSIIEPVYTSESYTEEYIDWKEYAELVIGSVRDHIDEFCGSAKYNAESNSKKMHSDFNIKFNQLNKKLLEKMNDLRKKSQEDENLQMRINENERIKKGVKKLQTELANILNI